MLRVQKIYRRSVNSNSGARISARVKNGDNEIGFDSGVSIYVYSNGSTLFYSYSATFPEKAGFEYLTLRKSFIMNRGDVQVSIPFEWFNEYCNELTYVKVYYTKIGLFVKPYKGDSNE